MISAGIELDPGNQELVRVRLRVASETRPMI
jgi:hypothetical protein